VVLGELIAVSGNTKIILQGYPSRRFGELPDGKGMRAICPEGVSDVEN